MVRAHLSHSSDILFICFHHKYKLISSYEISPKSMASRFKGTNNSFEYIMFFVQFTITDATH